MNRGFRRGGSWVADQFGSIVTWGVKSRIDAGLRNAVNSSAAVAIVREAAVRDALGRWVSELEPVLVYNHLGQFIGLTHAGQEIGGYPPVSVEIRGGVPI